MQEVSYAGCRMQHPRCSYGCMLAPYCPANETEELAVVHKVFGTSNVIKMLQVNFLIHCISDTHDKQVEKGHLAYNRTVNIHSKNLHTCRSKFLKPKLMPICLQYLQFSRNQASENECQPATNSNKHLFLVLGLPHHCKCISAPSIPLCQFKKYKETRIYRISGTPV